MKAPETLLHRNLEERDSKISDTKSKGPSKPPSKPHSKPNFPQKSTSQPYKGYGHTRLSLNNKCVSFSPLQGYANQSSFKKYSNDYGLNDYFDQSPTPSNKLSLPSDSWHYQIQIQTTYKGGDVGECTLDLDLNLFKIDKCTIQAKHNPKHCMYYHSLKDRRRPGDHYTTDLCRFAETDKCMKGDK
jgi:hypothetical protein